MHRRPVYSMALTAGRLGQVESKIIKWKADQFSAACTLTPQRPVRLEINEWLYLTGWVYGQRTFSSSYLLPTSCNETGNPRYFSGLGSIHVRSDFFTADLQRSLGCRLLTKAMIVMILLIPWQIFLISDIKSWIHCRDREHQCRIIQ